jgi:hypothetical protein
LQERHQNLTAHLTECEQLVTERQAHGGPPLELSVTPVKLLQDVLHKFPKHAGVQTPYGKVRRSVALPYVMMCMHRA